jgi:hypothetical protein
VAETALLVVFQVAAFAAIAYWVFACPARSFGSRKTLSPILAGAGVIAFIDGFSLAVIEEWRARYGVVVSGVVDRWFGRAALMFTKPMYSP